MAASDQPTQINVGGGTLSRRAAPPSTEEVTAALSRAQARQTRGSRSGGSGAFAESSLGSEATATSSVRGDMTGRERRVSVDASSGKNDSSTFSIKYVGVDENGKEQTWQATWETRVDEKTGEPTVSLSQRRPLSSMGDGSDADVIPRPDLNGLTDDEVAARLADEARADAPPRVAVSTDTETPDSTTPDTKKVFEGEPDADGEEELPNVDDTTETEVTAATDDAVVVEVAPAEAPSGPVAARVDTVVRRPTSGIVGYEDRFCRLEMFAKSLEGGEGDYIPLYNSTYASQRHPLNTNFLINQVTLNAEEAVQVVRTFGDYYLSDVGENPRTLAVQGVLIESKNFPWLSEWRANYDHYLRARQCILRKAMAYLTVDDTTYMGYIVSSSISRNVTPAWELVPFSFTMILRSAVDLRETTLFPQMGPVEPPEFRLGDIGDPDASTLARLAELVAGEFDEGNRLEDPATELRFEGSMDEAVTRINIEHLLSVARGINTAKGYEFINLQGLRNGYLSQRRAEFESLGATDPALLQTFGLPSRYEMAVDARRARVQEEYREAIEAGYAAARDRLSRVKFLK